MIWVKGGVALKKTNCVLCRSPVKNNKKGSPINNLEDFFRCAKNVKKVMKTVHCKNSC